MPIDCGDWKSATNIAAWLEELRTVVILLNLHVSYRAHCPRIYLDLLAIVLLGLQVNSITTSNLVAMAVGLVELLWCVGWSWRAGRARRRGATMGNGPALCLKATWINSVGLKAFFKLNQ